MATLPPLLRPAVQNDARAIAGLLTQLGYPAAPAEVLERLDDLRSSANTIILVAETGEGVVGVVTGHLIRSIHSGPPVAWLTTLAVHDERQRGGIGRALASAVEDWAREHGAVRISVTSGLYREGAHAFYERIGYARSGVRLTKALQA